MRTYDILNAGPHNRFTANGRVVSNSGRHIQLQNLVRNEISTLNEARKLVKLGCFDALDSIYESTPDILSQLLRTMLIPKDGCEFIVCDFSAIEARVLAWLAGEDWVLDAFRNNEDLYCATASRMFGVPVVKHGINGELRQYGKIATLACGYGGSVGALEAFGARQMGIKEEELPKIISDWRDANPNIVKFWWDIEKVAKNVIRTHKKESRTIGNTNVHFEFYANTLWLVLPSGRKLAYIRPKIVVDAENGFETITFEGLNSANKWACMETYSGRLAENCTQSTARDLLAEAMWRLEKAGLDIVAHIHDEVVLEVPKGSLTVEEVCAMMNQLPDWAEGLPLASAGYVAENFYFKD